MMEIDYVKKGYKGCRVDIRLQNEAEIPKLRGMLMEEFIVEEPSFTFYRRRTRGEFDCTPVDDVCDREIVTRMLSELWGSEAGVNVVLLLARALQKIVDLKKQLAEIEEKGLDPIRFGNEEPDKPEDIPGFVDLDSEDPFDDE